MTIMPKLIPIAALVLTTLAAQPGSLDAQAPDRRAADAVLAGLRASSPDPARVSRDLATIDTQLADVMIALHERFGITHQIPTRADPRPILRSLCNGCPRAEAIRIGYGRLYERLGTLQTALRGERPADVRALQTLARETVLLAWALKLYSLAEAAGVDAPPPAGSPEAASATIILDLIGLGFTLYGFYGTYNDVGNVVDTFAENAGGISERRRQAEAAGMHYPNACWATVWGGSCQ